jgi:hypothetical protein
LLEISSTSGYSPRQVRSVMAAGVVILLVGLPFHLAIKRVVPYPVGTAWKEIVLGLLCVALLLLRVVGGRPPIGRSRLNMVVGGYVLLLLFRYVLERRGWVGLWGLYASAMYLPLFWIVPAVVGRNLGEARRLLALMVAVGAVVAAGGLLEFVLDVPLCPSSEMLARQGFPDVYIYGTRIRRVYFTLDSPTTLANTLGLLLPLSIALMVSARSRAESRLGGIAAVLMAGCIVVTFSRGVWVSTAIALSVMGLALYSGRRGRRVALLLASLLAVVGLTLVSVGIARQGMKQRSDACVVELATPDQVAASVGGAPVSLLGLRPVAGKILTQTWAISDPIEGLEDRRVVLYEHPREEGWEEITFRLKIPAGGGLRFGIGVSPEAWSSQEGDGVEFRVLFRDVHSNTEGELAFSRYLNPKIAPGERRWRDYLMDLSELAGREVELTLATGSGPVGDWSYDWAGWSSPQIVEVDSAYWASLPTENAVLRHVRSVLDWVSDETNRDRLMAWRLSIEQWRVSPLWGMGLGTTGLAALRAGVDSAIVTESQVLKAAVELGLPGLLMWAWLWITVVLVARKAYSDAADGSQRVLILGIVTSLLVVFIEGCVYQNLEVKQVNAYFWTLVGVVSVMAYDDAG